MKTFADNILDFLFTVKLPFRLPNKIEVLDAHKDEAVRNVCTQFYKKFYSDNNKRHLLIGINPGRFGGGVTGIPFTDPIRLQKDCGIENNFQQKQELSSAFVYEMINSFGSAEKFYNSFYISAVSPLGFVREGKNLNYYDDTLLLKRIEPFVIDCMQKQLAFGINKDVCFCIGEGENLKYLQKLNTQHKWFSAIEGLPHPRFIMQYRLKTKSIFIKKYVDTLSAVLKDIN